MVVFVSGSPKTFEDVPSVLAGCDNRVVCIDTFVKLDRFIQKHPVDVLVIDLELADASGPGLVSWSREHCPGAAVIAVSDEYSRELDLRLHTDGVVHLAVKPVDPGKLVEIVIHCLKRHEKSPDREVASRPRE